jgi:hypothetical protein
MREIKCLPVVQSNSEELDLRHKYLHNEQSSWDRKKQEELEIEKVKENPQS